MRLIPRGKLVDQAEPCHDSVDLYSTMIDWLSRWREWLKKPTEVDRPRAIDLRPYLCEHTGLTSDLSYNDDSKAFEIITEDEWQALIQTYKSKSGLQVSIRNSSKGRFATTPSVCEPCRNKRRLAFEELEIVLKFLNEDDMDTETGLPKTTCMSYLLPTCIAELTVPSQLQ